MPYRLDPSNRRCVQVHRKGEWENVKCHETAGEANRHRLALQVNVKKDEELSIEELAAIPLLTPAEVDEIEAAEQGERRRMGAFTKILGWLAGEQNLDVQERMNINTDQKQIEKLYKKAEGDGEEVEKTVKARIAKVDEEKRLFYAVVLEPLDPSISDGDAQGDYYTADEIEKAMTRWAIKYYGAPTQHTVNHKRPFAGMIPVQNAIAPSDMQIGNDAITKGTWYQVYYVTDDAVWEGVKKGEYTGLSIGGKGKRQPVV